MEWFWLVSSVGREWFWLVSCSWCREWFWLVSSDGGREWFWLVSSDGGREWFWLVSSDGGRVQEVTGAAAEDAATWFLLTEWATEGEGKHGKNQHILYWIQDEVMLHLPTLNKHQYRLVSICELIKSVMRGAYTAWPVSVRLSLPDREECLHHCPPGGCLLHASPVTYTPSCSLWAGEAGDAVLTTSLFTPLPTSNFTLQLMYITKSYLYLIELQVKKFVKFVFLQTFDIWTKCERWIFSLLKFSCYYGNCMIYLWAAMWRGERAWEDPVRLESAPASSSTWQRQELSSCDARYRAENPALCMEEYGVVEYGE